jgi:hypothetical protein
MPYLKAVLTTADMAYIQASTQPTPAAHVIYMGDLVGEDDGSIITQRWVVALAVRSPAGAASADTLAETGAMLYDLHDALLGYEPGPHFSELVRENGGLTPEYSAGGFAYYPMLFTTILAIPGGDYTY